MRKEGEKRVTRIRVPLYPAFLGYPEYPDFCEPQWPQVSQGVMTLPGQKAITHLQLRGAGQRCHLLIGKHGVLAGSLETHPRPLKCREDEGGDLAKLTPDSFPHPSGPVLPVPPPTTPQLPRSAPLPTHRQPGPSPPRPAGTRCPGRAKMQPGLWLLLAAQLAGKTGRLARRAGWSGWSALDPGRA